MKLEYTEQARTDIVEIGEYIAEDNPPRARSFLAELRVFIEQIPENPRRYRLREEWGGAVRAASFGRYLALFEDTGDRVTILRVASGRRNVADLLDSKPQ